MQISGSRLRKIILLAENTVIGQYINKIWEVVEAPVKPFVVIEVQKYFLILAKGLFLVTRSAPRGEATPLAMLLRKYFVGKKIESIEQIGGNRIVRIKAGAYNLIFELFGKSNIAVEKDGRVVYTLRKTLGRREIVVGEKYSFPESTPFWKLSLEEIKRIIGGNSKAEIARTLGLGKDVELILAPSVEESARNYLRFINTPESIEYCEKILTEILSAIQKRDEASELEAKLEELSRMREEYLKKAEKLRKAAEKIFSNLQEYEEMLESARKKGEKKLKVRVTL